MEYDFDIKKLQIAFENSKQFKKTEINELLRAEVFKTLNSYLEICPENIFSDFCLDERGEYVFRCKVSCKRIKVLGILPNREQ